LDNIEHAAILRVKNATKYGEEYDIFSLDSGILGAYFAPDNHSKKRRVAAGFDFATLISYIWSCEDLPDAV